MGKYFFNYNFLFEFLIKNSSAYIFKLVLYKMNFEVLISENYMKFLNKMQQTKKIIENNTEKWYKKTNQNFLPPHACYRVQG